MTRFEAIKKSDEVEVYLEIGNNNLDEMGYTDHGVRHASLVAQISRNLLLRLGYNDELADLAAVSGYLHDIGNVVSRHNHGQTGAMISYQLLKSLSFSDRDVATIISAIGNHEEDYGEPISCISAALILADKSDVHRTRVRNLHKDTFDIHDRVNYAVEHSFLRANEDEKTITLELQIDTTIAPVMEYFEIFLTRMNQCRKAATYLGCKFVLMINETKLL